MATRDITAYKIVNPSAGDIAKDVTGAAISSSVQPTLNKGRATNLGTSGSSPSVGMTRIDMGDGGRTIYGSKVLVSARQGVTGADVTGTTSITSVANSNGLCLYTKTSHGLVVGDYIVVADSSGKVNGPQRVVATPLSSTFRTDKPYKSGAGTLTYGTVQGDFATMTAGIYLARRLSGVTIRGTASNLLRSGSSDYQIRRSIHKVEHGRTTKVAAAIRAGYWDIYNGVFTTAPSDADDSIGDVAGSSITDGTADHAAQPTRAVPGELVFRQSGVQTAGTGSTKGVQLDDYQGKTG
jgi:hypothetical protein